MRLIFLGTGGYRPNERRQTACLMLPECGVALDAGTGFFRIPDRLETDTLQVFLSHSHLDHVCGLTYPMVPLMVGTLTSLRVYGAARTIAAVRQHIFTPEVFPVEPPFEWCELIQPVVLSDGGRLTWTDLQHPGGSTGYRVDWSDRSMAYITDTTAPGDYVEFIRGVDVLVHECYFPDSMRDWAVQTGHSCASDVARVAREAGVGRLMLVHVDPQNPGDDPIGLQSVRDIFPHAELAEDRQELEF